MSDARPHPVLFNDFQAQYAAIKEEVDAAVGRVLASGWYLLGKELGALETALAQLVGVRHAVGVANGTEALMLALWALDIGPGHEVVVPDLTAYPTVTGVCMAGATPVAVDVHPATGCMDPGALAAAIGPATKAVMPVHLYGQCADMDAILQVADQAGLAVIEDCAQAIGASYRGRMAGSMGRLAAFSFYPTKNLGAYGDAGAVLTDDAELYARLISLRNYGQTTRYYHDHRGINSRLDELQAAILNVKLRHLPGWTHRRREIAARYRRELRGVDLFSERAAGEGVYHLFPVLSDRRDALLQALEKTGIQSLIHYPVPVHRQKAFTGRVIGDCPVTNRLTARVLSLPIHPDLDDDQQSRVIDVVNQFAAT